MFYIYKMKRIPRHIKKRLLEALKVSPIVFLNGARQTGKSTLVNDIAVEIGRKGKTASYVTFDRPTTMAAATSAPEAFLEGYPKPLIIDEVQMVPELFRALKVLVDEDRLTNKKILYGNYLLTGSANILSLPKLSDPLVGRMNILTLYPFTTAEASQGLGNGLARLMQLDFTGMTNRGIKLLEAIQLASFPEIFRKEESIRAYWMDGYLTTMLQRDVKQIAELEKISVLPQLLRILATRAGGLLNDSDLAREIGLTSVTTKTYRHILKMMFLTVDINPWHRNIGKRLVKAPKGYLIDTPLLCHMLDLNLTDIAINKPALFGHILENYVATEIIKQLNNGAIKAELYHFRTSDGKEVDFILEKPDGSVFAIEVKKSESVSTTDFKGIQVFAELTGNDFKGGVVLYAGKEVVPFGKNLWAVPFYALWQ
jgi:predicted AAA+ superfamily ATPase